MKILGIDPGYGKCGWAVLAKGEPNNELRIMDNEFLILIFFYILNSLKPCLLRVRRPKDGDGYDQ